MFFLTTLGFLIGLGWIGWQWLQSDRDHAERLIAERIDAATDAIAVEIRRNLANVEAELDRFAVLAPASLDEAMAAAAVRLPTDTLFAAFDDRSVRAFPAQRLLYYPVVAASEEPYVAPLVTNRAYMEIVTNPKGAIELFESLAETGDERAQAEALLGLARAQSKLGHIDAALATYGKLNRPTVLVAGRPAELLARFGRSELMITHARSAELAEEVKRLDRDLQNGRWQLTRDTYLYYTAEVRRLAGRGPSGSPVALPNPVALSLAASVDMLWTQWRERGAASEVAIGRTTRVVGQQLVFLLWRATNERFVTLIAGPTFLQDRIVGPGRSLLDRHGAQVVLEDAEGRTVLSQGTIAPQGRSARRTMAEAQLPWTLRVVSANLEADRAGLSRRRQLVIAGLGFLALFVVVGSYLSVRATTREIEAAQLKADFVAAVSHEFRTPLALLRQFSDLLVDGRVSSDQELRRYYAALQRGTRRLTRLVEDLLDFGRMEAGSRDFVLQPIAARQWFTALTSEFQEEVRSKGYELTVTWDAPPHVVVQAEESALGRALWNLLDNAVKYSPDCQSTWVSAECEGDRLVIRVRDQGIGVSAADQRVIFRKFVRASPSGVHGTGLGLAMVEQIVRAHGGEVHLESVVGEGSTFSIRLPATVQSPAEEQLQWRAS